MPATRYTIRTGIIRTSNDTQGLEHGGATRTDVRLKTDISERGTTLVPQCDIE